MDQVADEVRDGHVRRGELFDEALVAAHPGDRRVVAGGRQQLTRELRDRTERGVVDLAPGDDRHGVVEQRRERPQDARFRLPAQAEQDEVVPREQCVHDLRHHGLVVAEHALEERAAVGQAGQEVRADLVLHRTMLALGGGERGALERAEGLRMLCHFSSRYERAEI
jgi:hypothetical protein